jgi:hypothetical protein
MHLDIPNYDAIPSGLVPDKLVPERVLYEAEAPILFLTRGMQNQLLLAYLADVSLKGTFTTLTPVTKKTVEFLENGTMSVRDAIESAPSWLHLRKEVQSKSWALDPSELNDNFLPRPGTLLALEHEPVLRTRAVGPTLILGRMPASVVAFVADSTRKAMKALLDYTLDARTDGRPTDEHRTLYDLPIQSFAFASFELGFGVPDEGLFTAEQIRNASEKLTKGLIWASGTGVDTLEADTDSEREAILRATLLLTPPSSGFINQVEVSGSWVSSGKVILTKNSRRRVREALRTVDSEHVFTIIGRLGEIDTDKLTFTLRDTSDGADRSGSFSEDLLEEMIALLTERVEVAGIERRGKLNVNLVVAAPANTDSATSS